ncbi:MAG: PEP-CTERM/exosortase system-associated acyltransferase [Rhodoferax sp.]|uniref:PEP-CTERM/exosortase system-associated acyltransferase n=1 Tax=Rhodoferax sp. TaxID=50421 RepID=UPI0013FEC0EC|nr:PEP-CTERM/exosortase system-associated acyltransferase [Rhodoferax sp.]NDP37836.1 PEP-CTERM/exosortase system-associated acyltransferase [Rhodoferax sp.]
MKTHRFETKDHRFGRLEHPTRDLDVAARSMKPTVGATHWDQPGLRIQHRAFRSALELRYQVYCVECSFLSPDNYPDGVESDEHDNAAEHFYAFDSQQDLVGYVRLVRPDADQRFPFQSHCTTSANGVKLPAPGRAAEISRLMLRCDYRRQRGIQLAGVAGGQACAVAPGVRRDDATNVLLTLYRQMYAYSRANDISHWYAAMERPLARSLKRMNIAFQSIGPQTDYYGPVAPYLASLQEVEAQVGANDPALLAWLQQTERRSATPGFAKKTRLAQVCHPSELAL